MQAQLRLIASGSSGNALFVSTGEVRLLIDAGLSSRRIGKALAQLNVPMSSLTAVLLTHEHVDHVRAVPQIARWHPQVPIYASEGTSSACRDLYRWNIPFLTLAPDRPIAFGTLQVTPFSVSHDAAEPLGYRLDYHDFSLGIATDLGVVTPRVQDVLAGCRVLVIEANHNEQMLWNGPYPETLKRRIASRQGHLSNVQTRDFLLDIAGPHIEQLILAHLSEVNNSPQQAVSDLAPALQRLSRARLAVGQPRIPGPLMRFDISDVPTRIAGGLAAGPSQLVLFDAYQAELGKPDRTTP